MPAITRRTAFGLAALAAGCRRAPSVAVGEAAFQDGHPHIVVPVTIAGLSCLAVLDNGAPTSGLDLGFAAAHGLGGPPRNLSSAMMLGGLGVPAEVLIDDLSEMPIATELPVFAIAGMDVFRRYAVGLTFDDSQVSLYERAGFAPPADARPAAITMAARREPALDIVIDNGPTVRAVVDLGCSAPLLVSPAFAKAHDLGRGRLSSTRQGVVSEQGGLALRISRLTSVDRVSLAGRTVRDVPVSIMPDEAGPFALYDVILGLPLLRCFDLWLSLPEQIWMRATPRLLQPLERRFTGIQAKPVTEGLAIRHVAEASPAQVVGLKTGDVIAAIDGAVPAPRRLREAKPGEALEIRLQSGQTRSLVAARYY
jgi:hypothetical protein